MAYLKNMWRQYGCLAICAALRGLSKVSPTHFIMVIVKYLPIYKVLVWNLSGSLPAPPPSKYTFELNGFIGLYSIFKSVLIIDANPSNANIYTTVITGISKCM